MDVRLYSRRAGEVAVRFVAVKTRQSGSHIAMRRDD